MEVTIEQLSEYELEPQRRTVGETHAQYDAFNYPV